MAKTFIDSLELAFAGHHRKLMLGSVLALASTVAPYAWSANNEVVLYQVGKNGKYCVSITQDEQGCISGEADDGNTVNVMNLIKGKTIVFRNLSDAPHDMKFTGVNAEDVAAQLPNGPDAAKSLGAEDPTKQRISCSFHGAQLAVGYTVLAAAMQKNMQGGGHKESGDTSDRSLAGGDGSSVAGADGGFGGFNPLDGVNGLGKLVRTAVTDVANDVLAKGRPSEVAKLISARPELMPKLQQVRPLLAKDLANAGIGSDVTIVANGDVTSTGGKSSGGGVNGITNAGSSDARSVGAPGLATSKNDGKNGYRNGKLEAIAENGKHELDSLQALSSTLESSLDGASGKNGVPGRAIASPSTPDRTKLPIVAGMMGAETGKSLPEWNELLILGLLFGALVGSRWLLIGRRNREDRKAS